MRSSGTPVKLVARKSPGKRYSLHGYLQGFLLSEAPLYLFSYERGTPVPAYYRVLGGGCRRSCERAQEWDTRQARGEAQPQEAVQGHLAHKKPPPPWTLQQAYASGHVVVPGRGGLFL